MRQKNRRRWGLVSGVLALIALGSLVRPARAQDDGEPSLPPASRFRRLFSVSDPIVAPDRPFGLGFFRQEGTAFSRIHGVSDDSSIFMSDYAGVSLLRFRPGAARTAQAARAGSSGPEILLDSSRTDPVDGVSLARIVKVATNHRGVSGVLALRADSSYGVYRLAGTILTRLALLPDDQNPLELAIGDKDQIAYVAPNVAGTLSLFQTPVGGPPVEIVREGQLLTTGAMVARIDGFLTSNGAGALAFVVESRFDFVQGNFRSLGRTVLRKRGSSLEQVAQEGDRVKRGRGSAVTVALHLDAFYTVIHPGGTTDIIPRIGPDGTVVFVGSTRAEDGTYRENLFVQGPGRPLQPLLPYQSWGIDDYAIDALGSVAVLVTEPPFEQPTSSIYLVAHHRALKGPRQARATARSIPPQHRGGVLVEPTEEFRVLITDGEQGIHPVQGLTFDAHGDLFFLARNSALPRNRYGLFPVRLFQADPASGAVHEVEVGPSSSSNMGPLSITQAPVLSADAMAVGALVGNSERFATGAGGLFQRDLGGPATMGGSLVAQEADALPGADRVGIPQNLYYTNEGSLIADVVLPGGGSAAITVRSAATTASAARTLSGPASPLIPLAATGQSLGQPDRTLLGFLGPFVAVGTDGQLVLARYSQGSQTGEGLFTLSRNRGVDLLADTLRGPSTLPLTSFSESNGLIWDLPSVSPEGNIVFTAQEDRGAGPQRAIFQWLRSSGTVMRMLSDPQAFPNSWEAGPGGSAYVLTRKPGGDELIKCSLVPETPEARIEPLVIQGSTTVSGRGQGAKIDFLRDFVIDGAGNVFFSGSVATGREGLFHLDPSTRMSEPLALEGDPLPPFADGRNTSSLRFGRVSQLLRDSTRGPLLFKASVLDGPQQRQGLFQRSAQGQLETVVVEGLAITGSRDYTVTTIADADLRQTATGMFAFSVKDDNGRWMIIRKRPVRDSAGNPIRDSAGNPKFESVVLARDGQRLEAGRPPVKLNAGPLVSRTGYPPQQGPIFTLNDAGDVAFFASDGQRWAVYEYSDRP